MAERFDFGVYYKKSEAPKEWEQLGLYIKPSEICLILGVSIPTVTKWIQSGELRAVKRAGKYFINKEDFKAFMEPKIGV
jgi:excisionase family DNA binding protein